MEHTYIFFSYFAFIRDGTNIFSYDQTTNMRVIITNRVMKRLTNRGHSIVKGRIKNENLNFSNRRSERMCIPERA